MDSSALPTQGKWLTILPAITAKASPGAKKQTLRAPEVLITQYFKPTMREVAQHLLTTGWYV